MNPLKIPLGFMCFASAYAAAPLPSGVLWEGLPDEIPADFLEREGFLPFEEVSEALGREIRRPKHYALAPIATSVTVDGATVNVRARQLDIFSESTYAMIPAHSKIAVSKDASGREVWNYPNGTSVVHLIQFRDAPAKVFELRVSRRVSEDRWAFGSYSPSEGRSKTLKLSKYEGWAAANYRVAVSEGPYRGRTVDVSLKRVKLDTCQACHFVNSIADYQYEQFDAEGKVDFWPSVKKTGPCGFVPTNPFVRSHWAPLYAERHGGEWPFAESPVMSRHRRRAY